MLLDLTHLQLVKDSFVDETLQEQFSDLLFEVGLTTAAAPTSAVPVSEHKSYVAPQAAYQVLRYMVRVWDYNMRQRGRLWRSTPVVVYHGAALFLRWQRTFRRCSICQRRCAFMPAGVSLLSERPVRIQRRGDQAHGGTAGHRAADLEVHLPA